MKKIPNRKGILLCFCFGHFIQKEWKQCGKPVAHNGQEASKRVVVFDKDRIDQRREAKSQSLQSLADTKNPLALTFCTGKVKNTVIHTG